MSSGSAAAEISQAIGPQRQAHLLLGQRPSATLPTSKANPLARQHPPKKRMLMRLTECSKVFRNFAKGAQHELKVRWHALQMPGWLHIAIGQANQGTGTLVLHHPQGMA